MYAKLFLLVIAIYLQCDLTTGQRQWVHPETSAQEMRNPSTWYSPYYQAAAEAYAKFYQNAQEIRNQLWQQAYATGAYGNGGYGNDGYRSGIYGTGRSKPQYPSFPQTWG